MPSRGSCWPKLNESCKGIEYVDLCFSWKSKRKETFRLRLFSLPLHVSVSILLVDRYSSYFSVPSVDKHFVCFFAFFSAHFDTKKCVVSH